MYCTSIGAFFVALDVIKCLENWLFTTGSLKNLERILKSLEIILKSRTRLLEIGASLENRS